MTDQLMVDLETLGTNTDCPVISIGAAWFDLKNKTVGETFYIVLDLSDQIDSRIRFADSSTIKWWLGQKDAAKKVFKDNAVPTKQALQLFADWILKCAGSKSKSTKKCFPWGNSNSFDLVIMESLFKDYGIQCPWLYYSQRDLRTFREFVGKGKKVEKLGTDHNALDDAISQVNYIFECLKS
jgi:hypothetical protein